MQSRNEDRSEDAETHVKHSFSVQDSLEVAEKLEQHESELLQMYGDRSRLGAMSDDFENCFPSNTKEGVVEAVKRRLSKW